MGKQNVQVEKVYCTQFVSPSDINIFPVSFFRLFGEKEQLPLMN